MNNDIVPIPFSMIPDAGIPAGLLFYGFTEHTVKFFMISACCSIPRGFSETLNREDPEFGSARLTEFVATHDCSISRLMETINDFRGRCAQKDDATVILLRRA